MKRAVIFITLFLPVVLLLGLGYAVNGRVQAKPQMVNVGGSISTDTTWTLANSHYIITDTVTVEAGATLTVEAGVTIMFMVGQYLVVEGNLEAVGTAVDPILFTSIDDLNTNSWTGPDIWGSANFEHIIMRYADTALVISGSSGGNVFLGNSLFEENSAYPIVVDTEALHRLQMDNVTFSNNVPNRIGINRNNGIVDELSLAGSVLLTPQPGLEAYEDLGNGTVPLLNVPQGVTLTLAAGTTFMSDSSINVEGHLEANGTALEPVIFDDRPGGGNFTANYLVVAETGSATLVQTIIRDGNPIGLGIGGQSDQPVILQDVILDNAGDYPLIVEPPSLHRLQMTNVAFQNNTFNRVFVDTYDGQDAIVADVNLETQPGLDCYEFGDAGYPQTLPAEFVVPDGITLTVEPGVKLCFGEGAETLVVNGRLQAIGTPTSPITFTSAADSAPGEWEGVILQGGSSQLENVVVRNGRENVLVGSLHPTATVQISNSTISNSSQTPLGIRTGNLHQTSLSNVTFANNADGNNIVLYGEPMLGGDAILNDQPGLDAYIILDGNLSNWFVIPPTSTLRVNSGVTLKFNQISGDFGLRVEGDLQLLGTALQPVLLTSLADSALNPWPGIVIENGMAQLNYAEVRYGTYNLTVNNTAVFTPVVLQNSQLHSAAMDGLLVFDGAVTAVCSRFTNNSGNGVFVLDSGNPDVEISSSALVGNGSAGLTNQNASVVDARQNWWGDPSGPAGIGPGNGDAVLGNVLFDPWLPEDTCTTVTYQLYLPAVINP